MSLYEAPEAAVQGATVGPHEPLEDGLGEHSLIILAERKFGEGLAAGVNCIEAITPQLRESELSRASLDRNIFFIIIK